MSKKSSITLFSPFDRLDIEEAVGEFCKKNEALLRARSIDPEGEDLRRRLADRIEEDYSHGLDCARDVGDGAEINDVVWLFEESRIVSLGQSYAYLDSEYAQILGVEPGDDLIETIFELVDKFVCE